MVKIKDLVDIKKDSFFNGAVQAEWFYDNHRREKVSESYIFHGPKYYGVSKEDIDANNYKLSDTVSFTKAIYNKIYNDLDSSRFMMTIAGYGAGKSHLSLTLAALLSNMENKNVENILNNIKEADTEGYDYLTQYNKDKHLVLVLNGINDFNLNMEILRVAKETLKLHGLTDDIFEDMTLAYKTAKIFLEKNFEYLSEMYLNEAKKYAKFKNFDKKMLFKILNENIEDYDVYSIINTIYKEQTGNEISISEGISANAVLNKLHNKYVLKEKLFKSVVILFDEFGRYLEFASNQPSIAGETGLQQIFEAVQNASPSMLFIGFIQSDLNAYMSRVNNDNIVRYVGRYQISDKYYLSSNLETVVASLVKKKENTEKIVSNVFDNTLKNTFVRTHKNILRWIPENENKNVWASYNMFDKTILKGGYPIHPLTISLLSTLGSYMQQRSTLTFLSDIFDVYKDLELNEKIPFIYPTAIINSPIFDEIVNAEERGRVSGQNCIQYRDIIEKTGETLNRSCKTVLASILVMNLARYKVFDRDDCITAIKNITGLSDETVIESVRQLENVEGIIFYDSAIKRFNFMSDGNSKMDFNKALFKYKVEAEREKGNLLNVIPNDARAAMKLDEIEKTDFGLNNNIVTNEWGFSRTIIDIDDFSEGFAKSLLDNFDKLYAPDEPKGRIIYLYCNSQNYNKIEYVAKVIEQYKLETTPILIGLIHDEDGIINSSLITIKALNKFTATERKNFSKFYNKYLRDESNKIIRAYSSSAMRRQYVESKGIVVASLPVKKEMATRFTKIYNKTIPFAIDSFEVKVTPKSRKYFNSIIEALLTGKLNDSIEFNSIPIEIKNRINTMLSIKSEKGWKVFYNEGTLSESHHATVKEIADEIFELIKSNNGLAINNIVNKYRKPPYGLNKYALALMVIYVIILHKENIVIKNSGLKIRYSDLIQFFNDDKKEKFTNLFSCQLFYTEENDKDKIIILIETIEKNRCIPIDKAMEYCSEIEKIDEIEIPIELRGRYLGCKDTLQLAKEVNAEINKKLDESEITCKDLKRNPFKARSVYEECDKTKNEKIEGSTYLYSLNQIQKANKIELELDEILAKEISEFNRKRECNQNLINYHKNLINYLAKSGREELSKAINENLLELQLKAEENKKIRKYEKLFNDDIFELEKRIKLLENLEESNLIIDKWEKNKEKFCNINSDVIRKNYEKLNLYKKEIENILENSKIIVKDLIDKIIEIDSIFKLKNIIGIINNAMRETILLDQRDEIIEIDSSIRDIFGQLSKFDNAKYNYTEVKKIINELKIKYSNSIYIESMLNNINIYLNEKYNQFINEYLKTYSISLDKIKELPIERIKKLMHEAQLDFDYLNNEAKLVYETLERNINIKLNEMKIENILNIFDQLNEIDKLKCLEFMKSKI